jgi:hypothetical protein
METISVKLTEHSPVIPERIQRQRSRGRQMPERKKWSKKTRDQISALTNGRCAYCGCELPKGFPLDHVQALYRQGLDVPSNLVAACRSCNHYKSTFTVDEFRDQVAQWPKRLMRDSVTFKNAIRFGLVEIVEKPIEFYFEHIGLFRFTDNEVAE